MPRKLIAPAVKLAAVKRLLEGTSTTGNEARRLGVTPKAVREWRREWAKAHPGEAAAYILAPAAALKPPAPPAPAPGAATPEGQPPAAEAPIDQPALDAAIAADGEAGKAQPTTTPERPASPAAVIVTSEAEDLAIVEMAANTIMGLGTRGVIFFSERKYGVVIDDSRLQRLFTITEAERAGLRPAVRHVAPRLRELIGSDEKIAFAAAGGTLLQGFSDRLRLVKQEIQAAVARLPKKEPEKK